MNGNVNVNDVRLTGTGTGTGAGTSFADPYVRRRGETLDIAGDAVPACPASVRTLAAALRALDA